MLISQLSGFEQLTFTYLDAELELGGSIIQVLFQASWGAIPKTNEKITIVSF